MSASKATARASGEVRAVAQVSRPRREGTYPDAWGKATGEGVKVAVIDTGYVSQSDLTADVVAGYDVISGPFRAVRR